MLVAPAGYGKTTLAEQWVQLRDRRATWYTARRSSMDVAALALDLARAASELVPGCDERLREHLRAVPNPGEHVEVLAEILGEELAQWVSDDWLVFDEYQELAAAPDAERFVAELLSACPLQLLVASRQRPAWASGRSILYGEILELNQIALAMDSREAADVLADRSAQSASGLVALANGWPAVIGLASVSSAEIDGEDADVPESLYRFFAEEVFAALGEDVRAGLTTLAVAPVLDRELAGELLGADHTDPVLTVSLDVGILVERGARLELHPLARSFLEERSELLRLVTDADSIARCLEHYRMRRDWDAAFELIARHGPASELETILHEALDDLLDTARLSTIEMWCKLAASLRFDAPIFAVAQAELSLRQGRFAEAQTFAESGAAPESDLTFRALCVAGRAAHLAWREEEALELYRRAEVVASSETERRDALWGQVMCAVDLGLPEVAAMLDQLWEGVRISDPRDFVRASANKLRYQIGVGVLDLSEADLAWELIDAVHDPLIESSFQSVYANVLSYATRYDDAREVAFRLLSTIRGYHLDFALPYALYSASLAEAGIREWRESQRLLTEGLAAAQAGRNAHAEQILYSANLRVLAQQGQHDRALSLDLPDLTAALPAAKGEVICSRALVLAATGRTHEALSATQDIVGSTDAVEVAVLLAAVSAISALKTGDPAAGDRVAELERTAFETGAPDFLVTAYRSTPELLVVLLRVSRFRDELVRVVRRAHDQDLATATGKSLESEDPRTRLSPREREVVALLREGITNKQIASILYISEATVKVHVHHIYDKLGVRSRTALAIQAALRGSGHATSATEESDADGVS
jgi:ATP/maltotriose-dependent transcriptional regulator MalT